MFQGFHPKTLRFICSTLAFNAAPLIFAPTRASERNSAASAATASGGQQQQRENTSGSTKRELSHFGRMRKSKRDGSTSCRGDDSVATAGSSVNPGANSTSNKTGVIAVVNTPSEYVVARDGQREIVFQQATTKAQEAKQGVHGEPGQQGSTSQRPASSTTDPAADVGRAGEGGGELTM